MTESSKSRPSRLGRGIDALMGDYTAPSAERGAVADQTLAIDLISPNQNQPRRQFDQDELDTLAASIRSRGVLQPILVRPIAGGAGYEIVAGERRWRASRMAGLSHVPVLIRELNDLETQEVALIENLQRVDLNPIEEAEGFQSLMDRFGHTQDALASAMGKSRSHVANTLRLLKLSQGVADHVRSGRLSAGHARALLALPDADILAERAIAEGLSVRQLEKLSAQGSTRLETKAAKKKTFNDKDIDTRALELDIARQLGLEVDIRPKADGSGELRIKFSGLEQLDEVCRRLGQPRP
jgi:ParB family chromosome partitioning protein